MQKYPCVWIRGTGLEFPRRALILNSEPQFAPRISDKHWWPLRSPKAMDLSLGLISMLAFSDLEGISVPWSLPLHCVLAVDCTGSSSEQARFSCALQRAGVRGRMLQAVDSPHGEERDQLC